MKINIQRTFLPHTNAEELLAFYRDILGFEVQQDVGHGDMRWITVAPAGGAGPSNVLTPPAHVTQEPAAQDWGVRDFAFRDPAGNTVRVQQLPQH